MDWDQLATHIAGMTPEQRAKKVAVFDDATGDCHTADRVDYAGDDDVIDKGSPMIVFP